MRYAAAILALALALALAGPALAQTEPRPPLAPQPAEARRLAGAIALDGRLDEADWRAAPPLDRYFEYFPGDRSVPTERTETRFLYDDHYLYVGFRAWLRDPRQLRRPFVRRDKVNATHDYIQVYLDPQGTGRTSYLFRVNARGVRADGLQDEAKQIETLDPDYDWDVRSAIDEHGWSAELRIPLSTLRVARRGAQNWNVIVTRGVPRAQNTQMASAPFPHDSTCFLCRAGTLAFPDLAPHTERLILQPSLVATLRRDSGSFGAGTHVSLSPGLDAKWLPYGGAALDLTINPDFSQVEADSPQLTANQRFAISVPEKRPFFREGSDLIGTPLPALYTRTITAPDFGLRFTHRSATLNGTIFAARDGGRGAIVEPGLLFSEAALPDFDSDVGFAHLTDGFGPVLGGALGAIKRNSDGSYNALGGVDFAWQPSNNRITGQLLWSETRNPDRPDLLAAWQGQHLSGLGAQVQWDRTAGLTTILRYTRFDPSFRAWLGDVQRVGYQEVYAFAQKPFYWSQGFLNTLAPYVSFDRLGALGADGRERDLALGLVVGAAHNLNLDVSLHPATEALTVQGEERRTHDLEWTFSINPAARIPLVALNGAVGTRIDYATGEVVPSVMIAATLRTRPLDRLEIEGRYTLLRLGDGLAGGARLTEEISELLATWYFAPAFYVLADAQFHRAHRRLPIVSDDRDSLLSVQVAWELSSRLQAFFGVRSGALSPDDPTGRGRSTEFYLKLTGRFGLGS